MDALAAYSLMNDKDRESVRDETFEHLADLLIVEAAVLLRRLRPETHRIRIRVESMYMRRQVDVVSVQDRDGVTIRKPQGKEMELVEAYLGLAANFAKDWEPDREAFWITLPPPATAADATDAPADTKPVHVATAETGHFSWTATGATADAAREALLAGWNRHCDQVAARDGDELDRHLIDDSINVVGGPVGSAFRDYSPI